MRRSHTGEHNNYQQGYSNNDAIEEENQRLQDGLLHKVSSLKSLSIDIGHEVKYQNKMLNDMGEEFERGGGLLGSTMSRLTAIARSGAHRFPCYLLLFAFTVFFICWLLIKFR